MDGRVVGGGLGGRAIVWIPVLGILVAVMKVRNGENLLTPENG
jgi:hypothetical protein